MATAKRELRGVVRATLQGMSDVKRAAASIAACERVSALPEFQSAANVMLYLPLPGELDCTSLVEHAFRAGKIVFVPHADWNNRMLQPVRLRSIAADALMFDRHGVRLPKIIEPEAIESLQLAIVPGMAFDEQGGRLGRGGGFYDRFIAKLGASVLTIGLAFEQQIVSRIPRESHDSAVQMLATEIRLIRCE